MKYVTYFSQKAGCDIFCMKCHLFPEKKEENNNTNLSSAELAKIMIKFNTFWGKWSDDNLMILLQKTSRQHTDDKFCIYQEIGFENLCKLSPLEKICIKCQVLFPGEKIDISKCSFYVS